MRTPRLRVQLAAVTSLATLVLVVATSVVVTSRSDDLRRVEAGDAAQRNAAGIADVVAERVAHGTPLVDSLPGRTARQVELVDANGAHLAGRHLITTRATARRLSADLDDLTARPRSPVVAPGRTVGVSPVVVGDEVRGAVLLVRPLPHRRGWRDLYGLDVPAAVALALLSAALGWWSAGRISRPLDLLTEQAGALALGGHGPSSTASSIPEISTLSAAMSRLAARVRRDAEQRDHADAEHRRIAHEMRTPLTTMRLRLEAIGLDEEVQQLLLGQLDRLDRVAGELGGLRGTQSDEVVDLAAVIDAVTAELRPIARWEHVDVSTSLSGPAPVRGEPIALTDAVNNLVENAVRFTPAGGEVLVSVESNGSSVVVEVADSGAGFPDDARAALVAPGVRLLGADAVRGTGQGLAIVAATVDRHRGTLELGRSRLGGALVRIVLPAGTPPGAAGFSVSAGGGVSPVPVSACADGPAPGTAASRC